MSKQLREPEVAGPLGTLALSQVKPHSASASLRAIKWHADLERLGLRLPFVVVHDFGLVISTKAEQLAFGARASVSHIDQNLASQCEVYHDLLREARQSETARRALQLNMNDDLIVVVLARIFSDVALHIEREPAYESRLPMDASLFERTTESQLRELFTLLDRSFEKEVFHAISTWRLLILTLTDSLDIDTLRLFGMLGVAEGGAMAQVELLNSIETPEANDVVNFSLEILPSVLETKPKPAAGTRAGFGYSGLGRRGSIDSLVLTELAWDRDEFARRVVDNEVLYYAREQQQEQEGREHLLLIDASASMRGDRATFARAIALATGKKLLLEGEQVTVRFFDSRLYEPHHAHKQELPTAHMLSFKGERGRNPARVFAALVTLLEMAHQAERPVLHLFTHAALYAPRSSVKKIRQLAQIAAVFILPSGGELNLDYLDLLNAHWVVDHQALQQTERRADAARDILQALPPKFDEHEVDSETWDARESTASSEGRATS